MTRRSTTRLRKLLALSVTAALSLIYLWIGTMGQPAEVFQEVPDTATHGVGYGLLALSALATARLWGISLPQVAAAGYAIGHGALLEAVQSTTVSRLAEWRDLAWDALGAVAAIAMIEAIRRVGCR